MKRLVILILPIFIFLVAVILPACPGWNNRTQTVTVTFNYDNGAESKLVETELGSFVEFPEDPLKEGYEFRYWTLQSGWSILTGNGVIASDTQYIARYAKIRTITLIECDNLEPIKTLKVPSDEVFNINEIDIPKKDGYIIGSCFLWKDSNEDGIIDINEKGSDSIEYYEIRNAEQAVDEVFVIEYLEAVIVSFDTDGGDEIEPIMVAKNQWTNFPIPTKIGYQFIGWYADSSLTEVYTGNNSEDHTLYAKFIDENIIIINSQNFKQYFDVTLKVKSTYVNLGAYYTYRNSVVYSISIKEGYSIEDISDDEISLILSFEYYRSGYQSLFISEPTKLSKENNFAVTNKESAGAKNYVLPNGDGSPQNFFSLRYSINTYNGELYLKSV